MKQEQNKSIRTVKSISNNVLEAEVYYSSFNPKFQVEVSHPKEIHLATCSPSIF